MTQSPRKAKALEPVTAKGRVLTLPQTIMVGQLADKMNVGPIEIIKHLMRAGIMAGINQTVDYEMAASLAQSYGFSVEREQEEKQERQSIRDTFQKKDTDLIVRPPVVAFLGHVDHGKTSLLDHIRKTKVAAGEAGGITQRIGAYQARVNDQLITFLDTPGHEAFTSLRARGAQATDIAVLVVAADDGVMPQTVEAIQHIQAAKVPMIVAINKIDMPGANVERVKAQLAQHSVLLEEYGGQVIGVPVSATTGAGMDDLLESILLVAEVEELRANPDTPMQGVVLEARMDSTRGPLATVLVRAGTMHNGATLVAGGVWGRVRAMLDHQGHRVKDAPPSRPVEVLGLNGVPEAGEIIAEVPDEKEAKERVERFARKEEVVSAASALERFAAQVRAGETPELPIIIRADLQGSVEAIRSSLEKLSSDDARLTVMLSGTGTITESDVFLAAASKAVIVGFNTRAESGARRLAATEGVEIRTYDIIYRVIDDIAEALHGLKEPTFADVREGTLEVRQVFNVRNGQVAGCLITQGRVRRGSTAHLLRKGQKIHEGPISGLRHFQDDVRELTAPQECGIMLEGFREFEEGDIIEAFRSERQ